MEILITLAINAITGVLKNKVQPKYGALGVHGIIFALAIIGSAIVAYSQVNPSFADLLKQAGIFLASSIAMYEVILKRFDFKAEINKV